MKTYEQFINEDIESEITKLIKKFDIVGCSISVVENNEIIYSNEFGTKEIDKNKKIDEDTKFLIGSISKPIFALGVMILEQDNIIDVDENVNKYMKSSKIEDFIANDATIELEHNITLKKLFSHTAGLNVRSFSGYNSKDDIPTLQDIIEGKKPANSPKILINKIPGTVFDYSGGGTILSQFIIENKMNKKLPEIMDNILFKKLKLSCSYNNPNNSDNFACGHSLNKMVEGKYHIYPEIAAAGLWSSSKDLAKIGIEMCNALKNKSKIFEKSKIEKMLKPVIKCDSNENIGIGFFTDNNNNFYHNGADEGFLSMFYFNRSGSGVVLLINSFDTSFYHSNNEENFMEEFKELIKKHLNWSDKKINKKNVDIENYKSYEGTYYEKINDTILKLKIKKGNINIDISDYTNLALIPIDNYFVSYDFNIIVELKNNKVYIYQSTIKMEFVKIEK